MSPATLPLHSTAGSVDNGSALYTVRTRRGIRAPASRETKAARPSTPPKAFGYLQDFAPECAGPFSRTRLQFAQRGDAPMQSSNYLPLLHQRSLILAEIHLQFFSAVDNGADRCINHLAIVKVDLDAVAYRVRDTGWGLRYADSVDTGRGMKDDKLRNGMNSQRSSMRFDQTLDVSVVFFRMIPNSPFLLNRLGSGRIGSASQIIDC